MIDTEELKPLNLDKIILFGSYAYGTPNEDSDIDLYVVTNDDFIPCKESSIRKFYSARCRGCGNRMFFDDAILSVADVKIRNR